MVLVLLSEGEHALWVRPVVGQFAHGTRLLVLWAQSHLVKRYPRKSRGLVASCIDTVVAKSIIAICGACSSNRTLTFDVVAPTTYRPIITPYLILICTALLVDFVAQS